MSTLSIKNLRKSFGQNQIIKGISLDVERGQFLALLGPSGSGKTTILRCIAGLERPDLESGEIRFENRSLSGQGFFLPPEKRNFGMVFQNYAVWPHLNIYENVAFPLKVGKQFSHLDKSNIREKVNEALELVRLSGLGNRYAHELSGGQQQRAALARALVMSPSLLLLDEPLSNLDAILREELGAEIRRLQQSLKLTTILVTHDQKEALSLSDRIVVLNKGQCEADGAPEDLYFRPPSQFIAEFLAGAKMLTGTNGDNKLYLPRRWQVSSSNQFSNRARILSRIFLGREYEYLAKSPEINEDIRFFSHTRLNEGDEVKLIYRQSSDNDCHEHGD